jgi:polysaccharide pyruvyl transferase WcaK-like protein
VSTQRTLLLLSSQQPFLEQVPNLGDRALFGGLLTLIERHGGCRVLHAPWKAFPRLTGKALARADADPADLLEQWRRRLGEYPAAGVRIEDWLAARLDRPPLPWLARMSGLETLIRRRTGAPWGDALRTRLPAHQGRALLGQIADADAALLCAGGIVADHLGRSLPGRLFEPYLTLAAGKPTAIANYSVSVERPRHVALARAVLPRVSAHLIREPRSRAVLQGLGVPDARIIESVDAAFANAVPDRERPAEQARDIAIMVRGDRAADLDAWARLVETLRRRYGVRVHYLHGCVQHDPPLRHALGRRCRLDDDGRPQRLPDLLAKLGRMAMLITERYHGVVFGLQTGTPVLPIASTTHKTDGLLDLLGHPVPVLPPPAGEALEAHLAAADALWEQRAALSALELRFAGTARGQLDRDYAELFARLWGAAGGDGQSGTRDSGAFTARAPGARMKNRTIRTDNDKRYETRKKSVEQPESSPFSRWP